MANAQDESDTMVLDSSDGPITTHLDVRLTTSTEEMWLVKLVQRIPMDTTGESIHAPGNLPEVAAILSYIYGYPPTIFGAIRSYADGFTGTDAVRQS